MMNKRILIFVAVLGLISLLTQIPIQADEESEQFTVYMPFIVAPNQIDLHCEEPVGMSNGPWPVCPKIAFRVQSDGTAHLGPNIHGWSKYRLIRVDESHGNPWDQDVATNPIYDPANWDLVAELKPRQQTYDVTCQSGYYMVLGDMDLPDPRGVMPYSQFCLTQ